MVNREQSGILGPLAEILAHLRFEHTAAQCKLALWCGPFGPLVGCHLAQVALAVAQRRTDIVAAQNHGFFKLVFVFEFL